MELHFEVIRDKETIYTELLQSKLIGYQLAICYKNDENLNVKICNVADIVLTDDGTLVTLRSDTPNETAESVIGLEKIQSVYPIHAFHK